MPLRSGILKVLWAILCESSVVDQETNRISLLNILEGIRVPEPLATIAEESALPAAPVNCDLFILFARSDPEAGEQGKGRIRMQFPADTPEARLPDPAPEFAVDLTAAQQHRVRLRFPVLPYYKQGTYHFIIEAADAAGGWRPLFEIPLEVSYLV